MSKNTNIEQERENERPTRREVERILREERQAIEEATRKFADGLKRNDRCRPFDWDSRLWIRYSATDAGPWARPIPPGDIFYASPAITTDTQPQVGKKSVITARIDNAGSAPSYPTEVKFYWANPALANPTSGFDGTNTNLIATVADVYVPGGAFALARCEWTPTEFVNNGHECLFVSCESWLDKIIAPFNPIIDPRIGQRNVLVKQAAPGEGVRLQLGVNNLFPLHLRTTITTRVEHLAVAKEARGLPFHDLVRRVIFYGGATTNTPEELRRRYKRSTPEYRSAQNLAVLAERRAIKPDQYVQALRANRADAAMIKTRLSDQVSFLRPSQPGKLLSDLLLATDKFDLAYGANDGPGSFNLHNITLQPYEQRRLELEFKTPATASAGEFVVFHLRQFAEQITVGGYVVVIQVVEKPGRK